MTTRLSEIEALLAAAAPAWCVERINAKDAALRAAREIVQRKHDSSGDKHDLAATLAQIDAALGDAK